MIEIIEDRISILQYENDIEKNTASYNQRLLLILELKLVLNKCKEKKQKRKYNQVEKLYKA